MQDNQGVVRSAIFVDFDNIFSGLQNQSNDVAERFGKDVDRWDAWIKQNLPFAGEGGPGVRREILLRRCYLNPGASGSTEGTSRLPPTKSLIVRH